MSHSINGPKDICSRPTRTRFSGIAIGYNVSLALFGGTAPLICTWLIDKMDHNVLAPAYYLIGMSLVSFVAALFVHNKPKEVLE